MQTEYMISIGLVLIGILGFLYQVLRVRHQKQPTERYLENKEVLAEIKEPEDEELDDEDDRDVYEGEGFSVVQVVGALITAMITIFIGVSLLGPISEGINQVTQNNSSTVQPQILTFVPTIFVMAIIGVAIVTVLQALRGSGVV